MPRLTDSAKEARRHQIIDAARRCFERRGFTATSMSHIIKESGLSAGSIYSHFESKADILQQTAEHIFDQAEELPQQSARAQGGVLYPRDVARVIKKHLFNVQVTQMFMQFWAEAPMNPELATLVRGNLNRAIGLIINMLIPWGLATTSNTEDARNLATHYANVILAVMHGYLIRTTIDPSLEDTEFFEDIISVLPEN